MPEYENDYLPAWYRESRAAHAANEIADTDGAEPGMEMLAWAILLAVCIVSISAAGVLVWWLL